MPETPHRWPGLPRRLLSMCYEALLLAAVLALVFLLPQILLGRFTGVALPPAAVKAYLFLTLFVYFAWFWLHGGQTLAMKTWRIRLVSADGRPLRPAQALLRFALAWPSLLLFGAGLLWALFDRDRQFLHDRLAGTRLIQL